ncbi:MAG: hypothetical protein JKY09_08235 [Crocinitomicaceae bacterium]|nr:hypothetical protein [Crocinitomicaceae bacterium]
MKNLKDDFLLSKEYRHLNHGSFGTCPKPIFEDYQKWQLALETDPVNFFVNKGSVQLQKSKEALTHYMDQVEKLWVTLSIRYKVTPFYNSITNAPFDKL